MTEKNRVQSQAARDPQRNSNRPTSRRGTNEDPEARRAFEQDRLHPALRRDQQYPGALPPERRWTASTDDATAPARPVMPETLTDLSPELDSPHASRGSNRTIPLLLGLILVVGVVVLFVLLTQPAAI